MASLKAWVKAGRPRTLPLAITCVLIGAAISLSPSDFSLDKLPDAKFYTVLGLTLLTVIYLQVLANFANDYGDFKKGTDGPERADRAMASGEISENDIIKFKDIEIGKVLIGNPYTFALIKVVEPDLKEFTNTELICGKSKVKILKPEWI